MSFITQSRAKQPQSQGYDLHRQLIANLTTSAIPAADNLTYSYPYEHDVHAKMKAKKSLTIAAAGNDQSRRKACSLSSPDLKQRVLYCTTTRLMQGIVVLQQPCRDGYKKGVLHLVSRAEAHREAHGHTRCHFEISLGTVPRDASVKWLVSRNSLAHEDVQTDRIRDRRERKIARYSGRSRL